MLKKSVIISRYREALIDFAKYDRDSETQAAANISFGKAIAYADMIGVGGARFDNDMLETVRKQSKTKEREDK